MSIRVLFVLSTNVALFSGGFSLAGSIDIEDTPMLIRELIVLLTNVALFSGGFSLAGSVALEATFMEQGELFTTGTSVSELGVLCPLSFDSRRLLECFFFFCFVLGLAIVCRDLAKMQ